MLISSLWDIKKPTHYPIKEGDVVPGVVAVLFSPAEVAGSAVMSINRLTVNEATYISRNSHKPKRDLSECWNM